MVGRVLFLAHELLLVAGGVMLVIWSPGLLPKPDGAYGASFTV
jgi:hypothetical protein